ncbi:hypothetical protein NSK_007683 [Nannochloropsis salina CCMP1776]|uniref:Thioredoxin domain-containing protein n=1 Tax=Nannochloropsis salina CCMP1776 TaxID=1027361 RepID=A0A4D9CPI9_9STRA|nr:hypothetical protein NSK_007683 [Nannochloropsis salina CCMP1776]|eukprot:TFJ81040.1 hypothetical protein NSK_007683 [Nannochloropsis salina CCMP1776]
MMAAIFTVSTFVATLFCVFLMASATEVVELTDSNFEHLTQASTGATTGDWLVAFSAPWCGHCKHLVPTWEEVAMELKGEVNVAKVDAIANSNLASRFSIRAFPMLKFFHQGSMYDYRGPRNAEQLLEFARGGYKNMPSAPVPVPPTFLGKIKLQLDEVTEGLQALCYQIVREVQAVYKGERPIDTPFIVMMTVIFLFFGVIVLSFAALFTGPVAPNGKRAKQSTKKNN